jgi:DNA-binding CsgD family transcriptional regulator
MAFPPLATTPRLIEALELAYRDEPSDALWLRSMIEHVAPLLDAGLGVFGWLYKASDLNDVKLFHPTLINTPSGSLEALYGTLTHAERSPELIAKHYATPAGTFSGLLRDKYPSYRPLHDNLGPLGIKDILTVNGFDIDGHGIAINAFRPAKAALTRHQIEQLERVAAHLIAASRLRRGSGADEAILGPDGGVQHATGSAVTGHARHALSQATRAFEQARGKLRKADPAQALQTWRALVDGRWSVVDVTDTDGKRFLVARVNEPPLKRQAASLSTREEQVASLVGRGHSNKLIAYDLGIKEGSVAGYLSSAMRKLGVQSRAEVIRLFAAKEGPHELQT